ncbi:WD40 repeat-containing protein SMU1-like protein [Hesseltinella vesiculosa]|uniref:WD40 repeat-containing protein SMU1 n=1 Tax=Hesseltinella vesiculosa TaxID=101127 RepID=A0A1X2GDU6_9FUNG|nr:WD40 repeat-containing protein SMU1-like protein [Hesseltinella vesiculosa]
MSIEIESEDVIRLVLQFLEENSLDQTKSALEQETTVTLHSITSKDAVLQNIQQGKWDIVLEQVIRLQVPPKQLMDLFEHIILELAEMNELSAARSLLRQTQPMYLLKQHQPERYLHLEHVLSRTILDAQDIYPGRLSKEKRRQVIAQTLANEVTVAEPGRLLTLLDQGRKWQLDQGLCEGNSFDVFAGGQPLVTTSISVDDPTVVGASNQDQFTNELYKTIKVPGGEMYAECMLLLNDGQSLVTGSVDGLIEVWNVQKGKLRKDLRYQAEKKMMSMDESVISLATTSDDDTLVSGATNGKISIWKLQSGLCKRRITPAHSQGVTCLTINAEDTEIASGSYDQLVKLHNLKTGKLVVELAGHTAVVNSVRYLGAGRLLSGSSDGTIKVWGNESATCLHTLNTLGNGPVQWLAPLPGSSQNPCRVIVCDKSKALSVLLINQDKFSQEYLGKNSKDVPSSDFMCAALSSHGDLAYALTDDGYMFCYNVLAGSLQGKVKVSDQELVSMSSSPTSNIVVVNDVAGQAYLFKPA